MAPYNTRMDTPIKGIVRYDGTNFSGWQRQDHDRTVQGEIEAAMARIAGQPVSVQGAGRTDAGVHAMGQTFSCVWPGEPSQRLRHALSKMLEPEIRIESIIPTTPDFNARFSARAKRYVYSFDLGPEPDPLAARYAWHVPFRLDMDLMASLLPQLEGEHNFAGFQSTGSQPVRSTVRTIFELRLENSAFIGPANNPDLWHLSVRGDGFLYHMVRNIAGTLVEIARGRFESTFIAEAIASGGPFRGHCAPPQGLVLAEVEYEE